MLGGVGDRAEGCSVQARAAHERSVDVGGREKVACVVGIA